MSKQKLKGWFPVKTKKEKQKELELIRSVPVQLMVKNCPMKCICCSKSLIILDDDDKMSAEHVASVMWNRATVDMLQPGFGSDQDLSTYAIGICDDCLGKKIEEGIAILDKEQRDPFGQDMKTETQVASEIIEHLGKDSMVQLLTHPNPVVREVAKEKLK